MKKAAKADAEIKQEIRTSECVRIIRRERRTANDLVFTFFYVIYGSAIARPKTFQSFYFRKWIAVARRIQNVHKYVDCVNAAVRALGSERTLMSCFFNFVH
jgi:hypothetical protein